MSLTASFRVDAFRRLCEAQGAAVYVIQKGDAGAGAIVVKVSRPDRTAEVYQRIYGIDDASQWTPTADVPLSEAEADAQLRKRLSYDPDLWAIEVELREGRPPFEALDL